MGSPPNFPRFCDTRISSNHCISESPKVRPCYKAVTLYSFRRSSKEDWTNEILSSCSLMSVQRIGLAHRTRWALTTFWISFKDLHFSLTASKPSATIEVTSCQFTLWRIKNKSIEDGKHSTVFKLCFFAIPGRLGCSGFAIKAIDK